MLAFGYTKISFKPITSKTETWTVLQHYALKNKKPKNKKPQKTNKKKPWKNPPIYPNVGENPQTLTFYLWITVFRQQLKAIHFREQVQSWYILLIMVKIQRSKVSEMPHTQISVVLKKKMKQQAIPLISKRKFQYCVFMYKYSAWAVKCLENHQVTEPN